VDEETDKIRQHIDTERQQLGRNLDEIEYRVKKATDLKGHLDKNMGWVLGAAVAGGLLIGLATRKSSTSSKTTEWRPDSSERSAATPVRKNSRLNGLTETLDDIFDGLVAVVSGKVRSFVEDAVPGFREEYDVMSHQRGRSSVHQMKPKVGTESDVSAR
jgi:hypothetical protein